MKRLLAGASLALMLVATAPAATAQSESGRSVTHPTAAAAIKIRPHAVTITGVKKVGHTLTARAGTWRPAGVKLSYRWYVGSKAIAGANHRTLKIRAAWAGKRLTVRVTGRKSGAAPATVKRTVKVSKPAPKPVQHSCTPLTSGGNCYRPGEFCRNSDHGVTGYAGNGEPIVCTDNNGWRWEPR